MTLTKNFNFSYTNSILEKEESLIESHTYGFTSAAKFLLSHRTVTVSVNLLCLDTALKSVFTAQEAYHSFRNWDLIWLYVFHDSILLNRSVRYCLSLWLSNLATHLKCHINAIYGNCTRYLCRVKIFQILCVISSVEL